MWTVIALTRTVHNVSGFFLVEISYRINPTVFMDYEMFLLDVFLMTVSSRCLVALFQ